MNRKLLFVIVAFISISLLLNACKKDALNETGSPALPGNLTNSLNPEVQGTPTTLGRLLFFDTNLSDPTGQACASCHAITTSFSDPFHNMISPGAAAGRAGNRNAPTASYTMFNPPFHYSVEDTTYEGGLFVDGRVNTLEEQAMKPFVNPLEMNNSSITGVIKRVKAAAYYPIYKKIYGDITDVNIAFNNIVSAMAAFERSPELSPFTSKFDYYLKGQAIFTEQERQGLALFNDPSRAKCGNCHLTTPDETSGKILFTDFTYNSDGVPKNPLNPFYKIPKAFNPLGTNYVDLGLGAILNDHTLDGNFRVTTLRNVAVTEPYFHNGVFNTLEQVVHFYNTRDVPGSGFAPPEVADNVDTDETGNQHLTAKEEAAIVAFLKTLTDGYIPSKSGK
ncbi:MAG TPA: cytochrome c peroxidase [Mucilaginibacter sp.]|jgi:cytochrome c peroxidase